MAKRYFRRVERGAPTFRPGRAFLLQELDVLTRAPAVVSACADFIGESNFSRLADKAHARSSLAGSADLSSDDAAAAAAAAVDVAATDSEDVTRSSGTTSSTSTSQMQQLSAMLEEMDLEGLLPCGGLLDDDTELFASDEIF